jgi:hypothetical protein
MRMPGLLRLGIVIGQAPNRTIMLRAKLSILLLCLTLIQSVHARVPGAWYAAGPGQPAAGEAAAFGPRKPSGELRSYEGALRALPEKRGSFESHTLLTPARQWQPSLVCLGRAEAARSSIWHSFSAHRMLSRAPPSLHS